MTLDLWLEHDETVAALTPAEDDFLAWAQAALAEAGVTSDCELAVRVVDEAESREVNHDYRGKDYATNVLSFPADLPDEILAELPQRPLGDLVICAPVVVREAGEQGKPVREHWAHMTVHGVLHLLGHDHVAAADAAIMEPMEIAALARLGVGNPYDDEDTP